LLTTIGMTRSYRARRITQPIALVSRPRDPAIDMHSFQCFKLVAAGETLVALRVHRTDNRMFAFVRG
jgi:hypothetical protein